jgi:hypothetical protein
MVRRASPGRIEPPGGSELLFLHVQRGVPRRCGRDATIVLRVRLQRLIVFAMNHVWLNDKKHTMRSDSLRCLIPGET